MPFEFRPRGASTRSTASLSTHHETQHRHPTGSGGNVNGGPPNGGPPKHPSFERHFTAKEIAAQWGVSADCIRRIFFREPGVVVLSDQKPGRRIYRALRIPECVRQRVYERLVRR